MTPHPDTTGRPTTWRRATLVAVLLAGTALGGFAIGHAATMPAVGSQPSSPAAERTGAPVNPPGAIKPEALLPSFTHLVEQVKPAVVSITTKLRTPEMMGANQPGPMQQLPFPFNQMIPQTPQMHAVEARGSGFIVKADGTIVTNNHVVKNAKSVTVTLDDGTSFPAKVIGRDPRTDIAVLKIAAGHLLPYIQLGNSANVKPGEWVVAMGNPFGLGGTVTAGIVSAVSRDIGDGPYDQFIQIDAPINPGNSGGPLFTQNGKVIGMNTAILSPSGGSIGIGFAIPSDMIRDVTAQLETHGHVTRGYIGVEAQELKGATAKGLDVPDNSGALLAGVMPNGPAEHAGLQPGDVIEAVNGTKVTNPRELAVDVAAIKPGDEAHLTVLHDGKSKDVALKVAQLPNDQTASNGAGGSQHQEQLGLALAPLSPDLRGQLDVPDGTRGAVVRGVEPGSPAQQAGLQPGDVIVGVGTHPVTSPSEAAREIHSAMNGQNHAVALRVIRNGEAVFVGIQMGPNQAG
ncbi:MAG TPA: DegQ family serine endoprotease [Acetobacteraceae bacterium]|nr:DegQ family serine endoprotease [Acetobacteraceae bacterium]